MRFTFVYVLWTKGCRNNEHTQKMSNVTLFMFHHLYWVCSSALYSQFTWQLNSSATAKLHRSIDFTFSLCYNARVEKKNAAVSFSKATFCFPALLKANRLFRLCLMIRFTNAFELSPGWRKWWASFMRNRRKTRKRIFFLIFWLHGNGTVSVVQMWPWRRNWIRILILAASRFSFNHWNDAAPVTRCQKNQTNIQFLVLKWQHAHISVQWHCQLVGITCGGTFTDFAVIFYWILYVGAKISYCIHKLCGAHLFCDARSLDTRQPRMRYPDPGPSWRQETKKNRSPLWTGSLTSVDCGHNITKDLEERMKYQCCFSYEKTIFFISSNQF